MKSCTRYTGFVVMVLLLLSGGLAHARDEFSDPDWWIADSSVEAIVPDGDTIYIGGSFDSVGPFTGSGVPISLPTGQVTGPFPEVTYPGGSSYVYACVSDGAGGWYVGGYFTHVGGVARNNLAHILSDGTVDPAFDPAPDSTVLALLLSGSTLYVGGDFYDIGGQERHNIAALNTLTDTNNATPWNPDADSYVYALLESEGTVYVGGSFTSIGGETRVHIAALDATTWDPDADDDVTALSIFGTTVYVGGKFTDIGDAPRNRIAALDATGAATTWDPDADGTTIYDIVLSSDGSTAYVSGDFYNVGVAAHAGAVAIDTAGTGTVDAWNPAPVSGVNRGQVLSLVLSSDDSTLYAGGSFRTIAGESRNLLAAFDTSTLTLTSFDPDVGGNLIQDMALSEDEGTLYVTGAINKIGGETITGLGAVEVNTGDFVDWAPTCQGTSTGFSRGLAVSGSTLYAGGLWFADADNVRRKGFAKFEASVIYVDGAFGGTSDGMSWDTPFKTITDALAAATSGDEIWVAKGSYSEAITMKSGVSLYGGFAGDEVASKAVPERDLVANETIIDAWSLAAEDRYHVVTMDGVSNVTLDGFTITGGAATGGSGRDHWGGGIYCASSDDTITIANCIITENSADGYGAAYLYTMPRQQ